MPTGVGTIVRNIDTAIDLAWRDWVTNYRIKKVELTLYAEITESAGGKVKFGIPNVVAAGGVEVGIDASETILQELSLVLVPPTRPVASAMAVAPIEDAVKDAVAAIRSALDELVTSRAFDMPEAKLHLKFTTTNEGKLTMPIGHVSRKKVLAHDLVLHIGL